MDSDAYIHDLIKYGRVCYDRSSFYDYDHPGNDAIFNAFKLIDDEEKEKERVSMHMKFAGGLNTFSPIWTHMVDSCASLDYKIMM